MRRRTFTQEETVRAVDRLANGLARKGHDLYFVGSAMIMGGATASVKCDDPAVVTTLVELLRGTLGLVQTPCAPGPAPAGRF